MDTSFRQSVCLSCLSARTIISDIMVNFALMMEAVRTSETSVNFNVN
jgi:hypothetical protein